MPHLRQIFLKSFILHSLTSCQCLYKSHFLQQEVPLLRVRDALIYGNNFKSLGFSIILCPFIRTTVENNPLGPMTYQATGSFALIMVRAMGFILQSKTKI